jgi:hypothetical protein
MKIMFKNKRSRPFPVTLLLLLVTLLLLQTQITAQDDAIPDKTVMIENQIGADISFQLRNSGTSWERYTLGAGRAGKYYLRNQIQLTSGNGVITQYYMAYKTKYKISWDTQGQLIISKSS